MENRGYTAGQSVNLWSTEMPKKRSETVEGFGAKLAELRKAAGYTQQELAEALGTSQRMIAYYESPQAMPPAALLPQIASVLGVSTDELLGVRPARKRVKPASRLERRLQQIEKLDPKPRKRIVQLIDSFIEAEEIKQKAGTGSR